MRRQSTRTGGAIAAIVAGMVALFSSAIAFAGTPTLGTDCGAGASIAGSDTAGKVTLGVPDPLIPATGMCTLTFSVAITNPPACSATNESNGGGFPAPAGTRTTNTTLVIGSSVGSAPGDVISYHCLDY